jgi:hypothetical protein
LRLAALLMTVLGYLFDPSKKRGEQYCADQG